MHAYSRNDNGTLSRTPLTVLDDGEISLGHRYNPVVLIFVGTEKLLGWGRDDGLGTVYRSEYSGREIIVPERFAAKVAAVVGK